MTFVKPSETIVRNITLVINKQNVSRLNEWRGLPTHFGKQRKSRQYLRWYQAPGPHRCSLPAGWWAAGAASRPNPLPQRRTTRPPLQQPPPHPIHPGRPETAARLQTPHFIIRTWNGWSRERHATDSPRRQHRLLAWNGLDCHVFLHFKKKNVKTKKPKECWHG